MGLRIDAGEVGGDSTTGSLVEERSSWSASTDEDEALDESVDSGWFSFNTLGPVVGSIYWNTLGCTDAMT